MSYILTFIIFFPLVGAIVIALPWIRPGNNPLIRLTALFFTAVPFLLSLAIFFGLFGIPFNRDVSTVQLVDRFAWIRIGGFNVDYFVGVDGLSLPMLVLTTFLFFLAIFVSWNITLRPKEYFALFLLLETGVLGVFLALDFFLFFLFWEVELIPMFLIIGIWGAGRKEYSAMKFLVYTIIGSAAMFVGIVGLYFAAGLGTFDVIALGHASIPRAFQLGIFFILFFAYAVKLPMWPFHTWLPDAHVDAPTAGSVILAGVLLKMGGYAIIRMCVTILPDAAREFSLPLTIFAAISIVYGAFAALGQRDMKKLIAYSSVSHMGYTLLGIASLSSVGLAGAILQMFTHGTITGLLFAMVGVVYEKTHTREIDAMGGLAKAMPFTAIAFTFAALASLGLPGLSGFVAEFLVFIGTYPVHAWAAVIAAGTVVITAGYLLWMIKRVFFGPLNPRWAGLPDALAIERVPIIAFAAVIILVGVFPALLTDVINSGIQPILARVGM
jgi:NADH-quinone oxidoreductase subunit M